MDPPPSLFVCRSPFQRFCSKTSDMTTYIFFKYRAQEQLSEKEKNVMHFFDGFKF